MNVATHNIVSGFAGGVVQNSATVRKTPRYCGMPGSRRRAGDAFCAFRSRSRLSRRPWRPSRSCRPGLTKYLGANAQNVQLSRDFDVVTLTRGDGLDLVVSAHDHKTYEVNRPGANDVRDQMRKTYLTRLKEPDDGRSMGVVDCSVANREATYRYEDSRIRFVPKENFIDISTT
jgi:hypothetical protein